MDCPVPPARQRQHVNHLNMCRQRRTATKDTTRPVTLWQEGNFFPGRSKVLRYNARTGRRTALSPAPHAERLGDIRKKRPSCLASGSTAGGRQRIGVREESGKDAFPALAAIPRIWQARSSGQRTKGMEPFLLPARSTVRRVKKSRSGSIALKPQRRLPDKRPASHAAKAFSVRNAWRFSNHTTRRFTEKTRFSAWFGPDDAVPPPRISFFQRQNALASDNERIFCLPFIRMPQRRPAHQDAKSPPQHGNSAAPPRRATTRGTICDTDARHVEQFSSCQPKAHQHSASDQCAVIFSAPRLREPERLWKKTHMPP